GALRAAEVLAQQPGAHFALIPLENPDGYALHRELCAHAPRHMHHAARYTALGDDLEYRDAPPWYEREARQQALALSGADLHINLHGYPAHEWTRPLSGYIPRGFGAWTIPKGFFLIVRHHAGWADRARQLAEHVCKQLATRPALVAFNKKQRASYNAHAGDLPFEVIHGTACTISEVNRPGPALTLITEFPDETIYGDPFILAHDTQTATVLAAVEALGLISPSQ
ncbi:MAG: peptidase, partial [Variovorax sp.]|nr:peptidase [Variovorax sp.]